MAIFNDYSIESSIPWAGDKQWLQETALRVQELTQRFDPDFVRFRMMLRQNGRETIDRQKGRGMMRELSSPPIGEFPSLEEADAFEARSDGPPPLYLGPCPSIAAKYSVLVAIRDRHVDLLEERRLRESR